MSHAAYNRTLLRWCALPYHVARIGACARTSTVAGTHTRVHICMHIHCYMTRATDMQTLVGPLLSFFSLFLSISHSFRSPPASLSCSLPLYLSLSRTHPCTRSIFLFFFYFPPVCSLQVPPPETLYSFFLSLSHPSPPLSSPPPAPSVPLDSISLCFIPFLSVFPKLPPLSLASAYTVEAAQAAEGHRSQL